ncbi:MAG: hypothetical protein IJ168_11015 [Eubacterium sp.]|nr:hypothetical protein [Eubacterium sp.]
MKKIGLLMLTALLLLSLSVTAFAEEGNIHYTEEEETQPQAVQTVEETTVDASQPRLMVTDYSLDTDHLSPDHESTLSVTLKNFSNTKAIRNIKLSLTEETGNIKILGTGTQFVDSIGTNKTYVWTVTLTASKTATIGEHALSLSAEYEDRYYTGYSASDTIRLNVYQTVSLDYNGVQLPVKMVQEETSSVDMTLINSGKTKLRNIQITFDITGVESGGTAFVGELEPGATANASVNLRAAGDMLGETSGTATISYEDEFGTPYSQTVDLSTTVEEAILPELPEEEETSQSRFPFWWAFLLGGLVLGGAIGAAIPIAIHSHKQRLADEAML